jgi:hypothetical protein
VVRKDRQLAAVSRSRAKRIGAASGSSKLRLGTNGSSTCDAVRSCMSLQAMCGCICHIRFLVSRVDALQGSFECGLWYPYTMRLRILCSCYVVSFLCISTSWLTARGARAALVLLMQAMVAAVATLLAGCRHMCRGCIVSSARVQTLHCFACDASCCLLSFECFQIPVLTQQRSCLQRCSLRRALLRAAALRLLLCQTNQR